jgi:hypothetical protein
VAKRRLEKLPFEPLPDLMRWWRAAHVRGSIIGGLAVSLVGRPRVTRDVDAVVLVSESDWGSFLKVGRRHGFEPRMQDVLAFAKKTRVLLMQHRPSGQEVDISIGGTPFEREVVARASRKRIGNSSVPVATPEDLVIYKAVAQRPQDLIDIATIVEFHPDLDVKRVQAWIDQFAEILDAPEIFEKVAPLLANRPRRRKP